MHKLGFDCTGFHLPPALSGNKAGFEYRWRRMLYPNGKIIRTTAMTSGDMKKINQFMEDIKIKEHDRVRVIADRERYAQKGVFKGMRGIIADPRSINE